MHPFADPRFVESIRHHFVCLTGRYQVFDKAGNQVSVDDFVFSGFVIEIMGCWCFVTAGHVIDEINRILEHPHAVLSRTGFADYFSTSAIVKETTYFDWKTTHKIHYYQENVIDIAVIPLSDFYKASLKANGVQPIPVSSWVGYSAPECTTYGLLGLPEEEIIPNVMTAGNRVGKSVHLMMLELQPLPLASVPAKLIVSPIPRFAATILPGQSLKSPKGMSGGPIIGVRSTPTTTSYACVAIQNSWDEKNIVFGTPTAIVVNALQELLKEELERKAKEKTDQVKPD